VTPKLPLIIGVRHFSPACAHLVAERIRALRPRYVLIEGPADFNERLAELDLPHQLPLAIYSYYTASGQDEVRRASWSPFSLHAPEWQAIQAAREVGAELRFIDLPAWHDAFADTQNRYADANDDEHELRAASYQAQLCEALAIDGRDNLWDHLFEGELPVTELAERLTAYFDALRAGDPGSTGNQAREAMMARYVAWAMRQDDGPVVVVCGGYHAPALAALWPAVPEDACRREPAAPVPAHAGQLRYGSYLVPYHFKRLDAFTGYASGMSSPAYYEWVWKYGVAGAGARLLQSVLERLRSKKLPASTADVIAIHARAMGLARMRAHTWPLRCDWLDALAGSLVRQGLDAPLPWTYRGPVRAGTDPALVQVMDVLAGDQRGRLAPGTPQPPLVIAVEQELADLAISVPSELTLDLFTQADRLRSQALHRLALLDIPGFERSSGPTLVLDGGQREHWKLREPIEQRAALIEAASYGASLHDAALARLEELLRERAQGGLIEALAEALNRAAFAGLARISTRLLAELQHAAGREPHFHALGKPLQLLTALYRHGDAIGMHRSSMLGTVIEAAFDRALWLAEAPGAVAPNEQHAHINSWCALGMLVREALLDGGVNLPPGIEAQRALAVCARKAARHEAAPVSRGAALGLLLSVEHDSGLDAGQLLACLPPAAIGDALAGLLALARQHLSCDPRFVTAFDALVRGLDDADFLRSLPAMRGAFTWLPTHERGALATAVLALHQAGNLPRSSLTASLGEHGAEAIAHNSVRERAAIAHLAAWGITL
jgi:hypothetical protein